MLVFVMPHFRSITNISLILVFSRDFVELLVFVQSSNQGFYKPVRDNFMELFTKQDSLGRGLIVMMNGFDGLGTHKVTLLNLLACCMEILTTNIP